jgi:hypothetical protein
MKEATRMTTGQKGWRTMLAAALLLSSCTHHHRVAIEAPPAPAPQPRPVLPAELAAIVPPPLASDGSYRTINHGIDPIQTEWHVRAALNVAAIGCRGPADGGLVPAYNNMLTSQKAVLANANQMVEARFRAAGGDWQAAHDAYMTRLYNFFAQPAAKAAFCAIADELAPQAAAMPAGGFQAFAASALPRLEAPFIANYRAVDSYRTALAAWTAGQRTQLASAATPAPRLAYADPTMLIDWQPTERQLALR